MWDLNYIQESNTREAIKGLLLSAEEQHKPEIAKLARLALEHGPASEAWERAEKLANDEFWGDEDDTDDKSDEDGVPPLPDPYDYSEDYSGEYEDESDNTGPISADDDDEAVN